MRICESFRSIQGEGLMIGSLTYFIRLTGCNLSCSWCDTSYSNEEEGTETSVSEILELTDGDQNICITGGEPLLQDDVYPLMEELLKRGKTIVLETNGSVSLSKVPKDPKLIISMDIKCPSSGMEDRMDMRNLSILRPKDQLKFVVENRNDLEYAVSIIEKGVDCNIIISPVGGMDIGPLADEIVERRLDVRVLPQLHKIIWGNRRSV
jgi:Organic radical activating enzymes